MDEDSSTIQFDSTSFRVTRHAPAVYTVDPVGASGVVKAQILEMALEVRDSEPDERAVLALAARSTPYSVRHWKKLPHKIRQHYIRLARLALKLTRPMVAGAC